MRVIQVHNFYQLAGGEDQVVDSEKKIINKQSIEVFNFFHSNDELNELSTLTKLRNTFWNSGIYSQIRNENQKYDIAHIHNTFPVISPSIYYAFQKKGVPIVQTLHNYRLLCPNALLMRNGRICEECLGKIFPWPGIRNACYRNSHLVTTVTALMLTLHRILGTYRKQVDIYIALTEFARRKFIQGGIPAEKIVVKPNFVSADPGPRFRVGDYALFVGRLSSEKGVLTLLRAWRSLPDIPLKIVGDGPLLNELITLTNKMGLKQVQFLGPCIHKIVLELMKSARFLIFPSEWYETFGMVTIESYACGLPVIASRLGAIEELVLDNKTGLYFTPGDAQDLATKVKKLWLDKSLCIEMGRNARVEYEAKYSAERNYQLLMDIYHRAIAEKR